MHKVFSAQGVELDQRFGSSQAERRAAEDAADFLANETGVPHLVKQGRETVYKAEVRQ